MIMDVVFVALSGNVWVVAIAANDVADAAGSHTAAFPRSMMVFTGMAVLGAILAALMFRFSTRRPPELREVNSTPAADCWLYDGTDIPSQEKQGTIMLDEPPVTPDPQGQ